jgi:transcriptional regulator GlxA family with amidase domain
VDDRLWAVWDEVARDLAADWSLDRLAALYRASKEQFRRVCLRDLGRSPKSYRE